MKRKVFIIAVFLIFYKTITAQVNPDFPYKNTLSITPFVIVTNNLMISYERDFCNNSGVVLSAGICTGGKNITIENIDYTASGYLSEVQYRNNFIISQGKKNNKVWNRVFIAPYAFARYYEIGVYKETNGFSIQSDSSIKYKFNSYGGGILIGYNITISRFSFEVFMGGGFKSPGTMDKVVESKYNKHMWSLAYKGIVPRIGFNFGFSF